MRGDTITHRELGQLGEQAAVPAQKAEDTRIQGTGRKRDTQGEKKGATSMLGGKSRKAVRSLKVSRIHTVETVERN